MENSLTLIRDQQKESWNKFSNGWKKWDNIVMDFLSPMGKEIIRLIHPSGNDIILDVAAGTGEPGLTIAGMLTSGKVISADLSEDMLAVAKQKAAEKNIQNFETITADVTELPFDDNSFDAISCRFGFMFFPDMLLAAKEMARVLKPGGRIAIAVWNVPQKNFWVTSIMGSINKNMQLQPPPASAPGMFRCAADGLMQQVFKEAGLKNISETVIDSSLKMDNNEMFWKMHREVGAPIVAALNKADDEMKAKIKADTFSQLDEKFKGKPVTPGASALIIYGEK
ncbi:MAG: class I SAM-dependent methyltransferase [Bacteroidota bacterium]|nr:class I SAM-dependent methyltransferase [Bacteroidota bacterium]